MANQNPQNPQRSPGAEQGADQDGQQQPQQYPQQPSRTAQPVDGPGARRLLPSSPPGFPGYPAQGALPGQTPAPGQAPLRVASPNIDPNLQQGAQGNLAAYGIQNMQGLQGARGQTPGGRQGYAFPPQAPTPSGPLQQPGPQTGAPDSDAPGGRPSPAPSAQPQTPAPAQMQALRIAPQQAQSAQYPQQGLRYQPQQPQQPNASPPPVPADTPPNVEPRYWPQGSQGTQGSDANPRANQQQGEQLTATPTPGSLPETSRPISRFFWPTDVHPSQLDRWQGDGYSFAVPVTDPERPGSVRVGLIVSGLAVLSAIALVALSATAYTGSLLSAPTLGFILGVVGFILALGGIVVNGKTMLAMQQHAIRRARAQQARDAQQQARDAQLAKDAQRQAGPEGRIGAQQPSTLPFAGEGAPPQEPEPEPMVFEQRAPAQFEDRAPDAALGDRIEPVGTLELEHDGWAIIGVSLRGLSHKHAAKFREDAIAGAIANGWQIGVVCDGGGSYELARVGANVAAAAAIRGASAATGKYKKVSQKTAETALRAILLAALQSAHDALQAEEKKRGVSWQDMRTTLLIVVQRHLGKDDRREWGLHALGGAQMGDGAIVARFYNSDALNENILRLTAPDIGPSGNETIFFQDVAPEQWEDRIKTYIKEGPGCYCLAMTDGISDDFTPIEQHMPLLEEPLFKEVLQGESPGKALRGFEQLLSYERPGSFDDRSLVCIYRLEERPWK